MPVTKPAPVTRFTVGPAPCGPGSPISGYSAVRVLRMVAHKSGSVGQVVPGRVGYIPSLACGRVYQGIPGRDYPVLGTSLVSMLTDVLR